jgi:hypothetical protein
MENNMYDTAQALIDADSTDEFDVVAQRVLALQQKLKALVPYAGGNEQALGSIAYFAATANIVLVCCHVNRNYDFVNKQLFDQRANPRPRSVFEVLPAVDEQNQSITAGDLRECMSAIEHHACQIRSVYNLPAVLIEGRYGCKIRMGGGAIGTQLPVNENYAAA